MSRDLTCDLAIIAQLAEDAAQGRVEDHRARSIRALPGGGNELIAIWPGFHDRAFGLAVDVGSTTIAAHLTNLSTGEVAASAGLMNPQIRFGEDLMSRVSYVMMNPGGEKEMTAAVREALNTLARQVAAAKRASSSPTFWKSCWSAIRSCTICSSASIRRNSAARPSRWPPACRSPARPAISISKLNPGAYAYVLPCIAGHVGADTAGVVLSEAPHDSEDNHARRRCRHQCRDRAGLEGSGCSPAPRRPVPPSRARRSPAASAPRPAPSSASASIPKRSSRAIR